MIILITGTSKGIGRYLADYYLSQYNTVIGCSRTSSNIEHENYFHYMLNVIEIDEVMGLFKDIDDNFGRLDVLINNAGIASMNHSLLTPIATVSKILETNVVGTFLFCREAAKLMSRNKLGRIVNISSVAVSLKLEGEAAYAASKAAVNSLTEVLAKEYAPYNVTINAVGLTPIQTDLIKNVPEDKIKNILSKLTIKRLGAFQDVSNVIDFFIKPESDYITGQIIYLGGV